ncbi:MAG: flagellin lysine-N-methylase [Gammaproteobacteria bacterium]|nr:flagellin lysine-N-methylase [Gammaproteobacteria bacterium]
MGLTFKSFNYLPGFSCLGGDCEDTCCKDWDIWFDQSHYQLLADTAEQKGSELTKKINTHILIDNSNQETGSELRYARLKLEKDGSCPFLLNDGWCELHREFGEQPLSNVCAYFPRVLSRQGNTIELSGALSCPEMVRQCLFGENNVELIEVKSSILPRPDDYPLTRELNLPADNFYYDNFVDVRDVLIKFAGLEGFPLISRLYFMASFANRLGLFYHLEAETADNLLANELKQASSLSMLERMDDYVSKFDSTEPVAIIVVQAVLQLRMQQFSHEKYSQVIKRIFSHYGELMTKQSQVPGKEEVLPAEELWQQFTRQRVSIDELFSEELENCFSRYIINCLYREWFITMPDLFTYVHMLIIRLAILRFLVYSHPDIYQLAQEIKHRDGSVKEDEKKLFRNYLVDVVYKNSRAIDHNTAFLQVVYDAIHEQQMMTFEYSLPFIKF